MTSVSKNQHHVLLSGVGQKGKRCICSQFVSKELVEIGWFAFHDFPCSSLILIYVIPSKSGHDDDLLCVSPSMLTAARLDLNEAGHRNAHTPGEAVFLILATDGLWEFVTDQEAVDIVSECSEPRQAVERLIHEAGERWMKQEQVKSRKKLFFSFHGFYQILNFKM